MIYLISRVLLAWTFLNFLAHCESISRKFRENDFKKKLIFLDILQGKVQRPLTGIDWKRYPKELAPSKIKKSKRTSTAKVKTDVKRRKLTDTANILDKLEKNEENEEKDQDDDETSNPGAVKYDILVYTINFTEFVFWIFSIF